eukprot:TRINITY_DN19994_c0_g1_i1.p1 TRINITY_DN19994_c0_g1~~TRINITY_DN19994_c0_g1_i1.p1  ORF type:complete len:825 (+),score=78.19 TRINITY_DN19994_c0_g1_i1:50-2524(+)
MFVLRALRTVLVACIALLQLGCVAYFCLRAYRIRLHAVNTYGKIIHEFDPWFNYRAAEYLAEHGWSKFFKWYDYMSWYPIGRPIGTTIYPGMQIVAVYFWEAIKYVPDTKLRYPALIKSQLPKWALEYFPNAGKALHFAPMSLNDVCVMMPAWFGGLATFSTYLLTVELSGSRSAGVFSAFIMAIIPAHIMRSYAGEFENEAIAVTFFCLVLWLWARSLRSRWPLVIGFFAGIAYICAAATWGGYIFINNLVGLHAAVLVALGKYNSSVYKAYSAYWIVGSLGASRVPVIGLAPFRSLEQMPSFLVFLGFQVLQLCDVIRARRKGGMSPWAFFRFRVCVFLMFGAALAAAGYVLTELGIFTPLGARIRGLFLEATKTGNPLVDSVAEHRPANAQAYEHYLYTARYLAVAGLLFCWHQRSHGKFLVVLYAAVAYHYSLKMSRLIIICGPIVSVLAGFSVGVIVDWCITQGLNLICGLPPPEKAESAEQRTGGMGSILRTAWKVLGRFIWPQEAVQILAAKEAFQRRCWYVDRPLRVGIAACILYGMYLRGQQPAKDFIAHCDRVAKSMSHPRIAFMAQGGQIIDDYLRGYEWIEKNTPKDSRVIAWWDYGYQITGIAKRTSIADGNTWNHEHIATLGRILTSKEKRAHNAIRHLADYALVWAGGRGDDMAKSPHLARIGNSVFPDHCGDEDPMCNKFSFYQGGHPTPMMAESFLFRAVKHGMNDVKLNSKLFKEVHTTKHGLMRVFQVLNVSQESKDWIADPANRVCDAPGSWYCVGQYPPALQSLIAKRRNFAQLEDFNKKGEKREKSAYSKMIEKERNSKKEL